MPQAMCEKKISVCTPRDELSERSERAETKRRQDGKERERRSKANKDETKGPTR